MYERGQKEENVERRQTDEPRTFVSCFSAFASSASLSFPIPRMSRI